MERAIHDIITESVETKQKTLQLVNIIEESAQLLIDALKAKHTILVCGNGGSAADAQHMAGELIGRFEKERAGLPCIALTTDSSVITAWSNDYEYATIFSRQVSAIGQAGDVLVGISTSGNSTNVIYAVEEAKKKGMKSIVLTGKDGGLIKCMEDVITIVIPSNRTPRIQEAHIMIIHIWCHLIEDTLF